MLLIKKQNDWIKKMKDEFIELSGKKNGNKSFIRKSSIEIIHIDGDELKIFTTAGAVNTADGLSDEDINEIVESVINYGKWKQ